MTPRAAARQDQAEVVSEPGRALAEAEVPGKPPPPPAAQKAAAPRATAGVAGAAGPVGSGGGVEGAEAPLFRAAEPGERLRTLGAPAPATGLAKPNVSAVSEPFWHLRVEAPGRLVVGIPAEFGLTIEGRQSLVAVRAGVQDSQGRPLGREVELALVEEGRRVQASLPATMQKPGRQQVAVALEAEEPAVKTRVTMMVDVEPPPSPEVPMASLVLRDVPLREAAAALARRGRVTVEVDDALANLTVDCNFADPIPVETALELLVEQVG
ncbi:MAG: hypothetical protein N2512_06250, partial [Armatimonadetes bacterium]|nr:hypothetical protein [Armatimonadota bacterium]